MKVLVKHAVNLSNQKLIIEFNSEALILELRKTISIKLGLCISLIQLTTKKCGVLVLMTDTWPLSFFIQSEKAVIKLSLLDHSHSRNESPDNFLTFINRTRGLSSNLSSLEALMNICKIGSVLAMQDFINHHENDIKEEDLLNQEEDCK